MHRVLVSILIGILDSFLFNCIICRLIPLMDDKSTLPTDIRKSWIFISLAGGCFNSLCFDYSDAWLVNILFIFLLVQAYCDYYTFEVYVFFSIVMAVVGYSYGLLSQCIGVSDLKIVIEFFVIVLISKLCGAINWGDVETLVAIVPFLLCIFTDKSIYSLTLFYCISLALGILIYVKNLISKKSRYVPYCVGVLAGYFIYLFISEGSCLQVWKLAI